MSPLAILAAVLLGAAGWEGAAGGALAGLGLAILPALILVGSVVWEGVPVRTAVLHAGDWTVKLPVACAVVGALS
ncbi:hypothetical protein [Euzebya sp.]|uniref:hypothetical protein n=1 Tax=Euzebya sp. TaxID=1971409 RepID=UPI0035122699